MTNLIISGVQHQMGDLPNWPLPQGGQLFVQQLAGTAYLSARHIKPAELLHDVGGLAGGNSLDASLRDGQFQRPFASNILFSAEG